MEYETLTADSCKAVLDLYDEIEARHGSSTEIFTIHGFSLRDVLEPAMAERNRIIQARGEYAVALAAYEALENKDGVEAPSEPTSEYLDVQALKPITE